MDAETEVEGSDEESPDHVDEESTGYERRPQHEQCLAEVFRVDSDELIARLTIDRFDQPGFIPAEVLVTLARSGFGSAHRVRKAIAEAMNRCLLMELRFFLRSNPKWYSVIKRSGEAEIEVVADVRSGIFASRHEVSFAEVSFRLFVDKRLRDWFKAQARWKNSMPSVDSLTSGDVDRPSMMFEMEDGPQLRPEQLFALKQLVDRSLVAVAKLAPKQRRAVTLCFLQEMTFKEAGEQMELDESSVRYHVKSALKALQEGDWHE